MTKFKGPGNPWREKVEKLRLDCFWEGGDLEDKQFMFQGYENRRSLEDTPKGELKTEEYLDKWWNRLKLGNKRKHIGKRHIYWAMMEPFSEEEKAPILEHIQECLSKKLALLEKA
ncbi:hypothetical protein ES705_30399 [subsurface metagenome]